MMQNKIHSFRAATMDEALDLVHQQLGQDFVIIDSKEIPKRRMLPWSTTNHDIEIFAEQRFERQTSKPQVIADQQTTSPSRTIRSLAETMSQPDRIATLLGPIPDLPTEKVENVFASDESPGPATSRFSANNPVVVAAVETDPTDHESNRIDFRKNLESLQQLISQLERQTRPAGMSDVPNELFEHYHKLIVADIEDEIARDLVAKLRRQASAELLKSPNSATTVLTALIEREMRCAPPIKLQTGRREIVSLVGPTGVGKTTTIAKLAGQFHLKEGFRVGLITVDNYRVGAVEQLQTYANILQVSLKNVSQPDELRIAIDEFDDVDLILIDTAGRNPFDRTKMADLTEIIKASGSDHVLLVLSLAAGPKILSRIADQFAVAEPTSLVLTKVDEAPSCGGLLSVAREIPHPVSYLSTGQDVPDQIEPAHPTRMARLVLGRDRINQNSETAFELSLMQ